MATKVERNSMAKQARNARDRAVKRSRCKKPTSRSKYDDGYGIIKKVADCYNNCGMRIEYYAHKDDRPLRKVCDRCKEYGAPGERFHNLPSMPAY